MGTPPAGHIIQYQPSRSTGGTHNPIPSVALVELGTFCRSVFRAVAIEHNHGVANLLHAVGTHFTYRQDRIELTTRVCPSVHQIALAVVVPKRRGIYHTLTCDNALRLRPFAFRVFGGSHKHAQIRVAPIDIIGLIILIIADAWCPNAVSMLGLVISLQRRQCLDGIVHNLPIHQILRMENGQAGNAIERGSRQIEVFARSSHAHIRVAIVGIDDGIRKGAVAIVRAPHLRFVLRLHHQREQ